MNESLNPKKPLHLPIRTLAVRAMALLAATLISPWMTGCGKNGTGGLVSSAQFRTLEESGELLGDLTLLLKTGNLRMPSFEIPIYDSYPGGRAIGSIGMRDALSAGTQLQVQVNLGAIGGINAENGSRLPNGRPIPVVLTPGTTAVALPIRGNSKLYFAFSETQALLGTALVIPEFDNLSGNIGAIDLYFPFEDASGLRGVAGLFSSDRPGQSGLAVFVDVGPALKPSGFSSKASVATVATVPEGQPRMEFAPATRLSRKRAYRLNELIQELAAEGRRLTLQ